MLVVHRRLGSSHIIGGNRVAHRFSFLSSVLSFVYLPPSVPNVASFSGLSILDSGMYSLTCMTESFSMYLMFVLICYFSLFSLHFVFKCRPFGNWLDI